MFNPDVKNQYIQSVMKSSKNTTPDKFEAELLAFFKRLEEQVEAEFNKDFAMLNYNEMETALSILCKRGIRYQVAIIYRLRNYIEWCISKGLSLDQENRLDGIKPSDVDTTVSIRMSMVKDEAHLIKYLDMIFKPIEDKSSDNEMRVCCLLVFLGLTFAETFELKQSNITGDIIILNDKIFQISEHLKYVINNLDLTNTLNENLLENTASAHSKISRCFYDLKVHLGNTISVTISDIHMSGVFSRTYQKEKETGIIEFETISEDDTALNLQDLLLSYAEWKRAFSL